MVRALMRNQVRGWVFTLKLLLLLMVLCMGVRLYLVPLLVVKVLGIALVGAMLAHSVELQHQCLHGTAYKNRRLNDLVGFLLGLSMLVSFRHYKYVHMHHHARLGTDEDAEFFDYTKKKQKNRLAFFFFYFGPRRFCLRCVMSYVLCEVKRFCPAR